MKERKMKAGDKVKFTTRHILSKNTKECGIIIGCWCLGWWLVNFPKKGDKLIKEKDLTQIYPK
jgi:hypothetical protein